MMTSGRLRAIESYVSRAKTETSAEAVLVKQANELIDEVRRLRCAIEAFGKNVADVLSEPDRGRPDYICTRKHLPM